MNDNKMTPGELRATWGLGTVFSLRMLGMFMVLPARSGELFLAARCRVPGRLPLR